MRVRFAPFVLICVSRLREANGKENFFNFSHMCLSLARREWENGSSLRQLLAVSVSFSLSLLVVQRLGLLQLQLSFFSTTSFHQCASKLKMPVGDTAVDGDGSR